MIAIIVVIAITTATTAITIADRGMVAGRTVADLSRADRRSLVLRPSQDSLLLVHMP
jgi:hypothetical protein